jgi:hypothetical protein
MTPPTAQHIVVVDLRIPFVRLVFFFVKAALAAIPAAVIFGALMILASALLVGLLGGDVDVILRRWTS